ncbi:MAG: DUF2163 domain-containing protein [Sporomusaceae bacterium]|nr:DUF2163 domain-containing protein [Sporomusaceae bacterium]
MSTILDFPIVRNVGAAPDGGYQATGDLTRTYGAGTTIPITRSVNREPEGGYQGTGDVTRTYLVGGLPVPIMRKVNILPQDGFQSTGELRREYLVGGLPIPLIRKVNAVPAGGYAATGDLFRIKNKTLYGFGTQIYLNLRTLQPSGIPWLKDKVTSAAWCWKLTLKDGTVLGFTNHDEDIVLNGITYEAAAGFVPTAVATSNDMAVDNLEVEGYLDSDRINEKDIASGRFDFAKVEIFLCNWMKTKDPLFIIRKGTIGQVRNSRYGFQAEVRGLLEAYQQSAGTVYQKSCRAKLGDSRCKIELSRLPVAGQVTQANSDGTFSTNLTNLTGYFDYGVLTFTAGANAGGQYEVKIFDAGLFTLFLPTTYPIAASDAFTVLPGCDGNFSTCRAKFNNGLNFRGEPHIPGNDFQSAYPGQGSSNTVAEGADPKRG